MKQVCTLQDIPCNHRLFYISRDTETISALKRHYIVKFLQRGWTSYHELLVIMGGLSKKKTVVHKQHGVSNPESSILYSILLEKTVAKSYWVTSTVSRPKYLHETNANLFSVKKLIKTHHVTQTWLYQLFAIAFVNGISQHGTRQQ